MLSTVGTNFYRNITQRNILESQEETTRKEGEINGSVLKRFSSDEYFERRLRLSINSTIKSNDLYKTNNGHEIVGFKVMRQSIVSIQEAVSQFSEVLNAYRLSDDDEEGLRERAAFLMRSVIVDLNAQWNGRYLFASEKNGVKPVDEDFINTDTSMTFSLDDGLLDYSYYHGGTEKVALQLTRTLTTSYELHAGDMNFAFVLNSLNAFVNKQIDKVSAEDVYSYLREISKGLQGLISKVDAIAASIDNALEVLEEENKSMTQIIQENKNFDLLQLYSDLVDHVRNLSTSLDITKNIDKSRWGNNN